MNTQVEQLSLIRQKIDQLDQQILELINQRALCALEVGKVKRATTEKIIFYRPEREAQIFQQLAKKNKGPLPKQEIKVIFKHILSACRKLQQPLTIAILKNKPMTQSAAQQHFGSSIKTQSVASIEQIFQQVLTQQADYGVVPIEHSRKGIVAQTLDAFIATPVQICGEIEISENKQGQSMRFLIISEQFAAPSGNDKTSLLISTTHQPGSLIKFSQPFAKHEINITAIATHPLNNQLWRYLFFLEIEGHQQDKIVKTALTELSQHCLTYQLLGSYPKAMP